MEVSKHVERINKPDAVKQDMLNILFSGTLVVRGKAIAVVIHTGPKTAMGAIASELNEKEEEKTPLQKKLDEFGEQLSKVIMVICVVVWLINIGHFTDPDHGGLIRGAIYYFKIAVALAVAAIPEGLPAVVTTCLALGTMKMAKKNAIVRSLPSVETLGCTTVICSDKTGTLTTNMMSVQKILAVDSAKHRVTFKEFTVEGDSFSPIGRVKAASESKSNLDNPSAQEPGLTELARICSLCNESNLEYRIDEKNKEGSFQKSGAPTEAALKVVAEKLGVPEPEINARNFASRDPRKRATAASDYWNDRYERKHLLEFSRDRKSMSVIVFEKQTRKHWLFCKGAPESVLARCSHIRGASGEVAVLTQATRDVIDRHMEQYTHEGLRVLGLSYVDNPNMDADFVNLEKFAESESRMTFVGLVSMLDPPRAGVDVAIEKCRTAGIRVIVITGDNKATAESICRRIAVFSADEDVTKKSFTGAEFDRMSDVEKDSAVRNASLFSRVEPKHKSTLVGLLKAQGQIVAMTGDGVNDATALKKADIGIAMGSGTDVAREASNMVLQDDNFATIVMAVEEGRAIYSNTKQFIRYLISSNIGEVACIFLTAAIGMPEALIPVQLLWVNLVTDGLPATALGFNPPDKDIMKRAPRGREESIVNGWMFFRYLVIGLYVGIGTIWGFIYWYMYYTGGPQITFAQLTHFHECLAHNGIYEKMDCSIFHDARPSTVSLSILVLIEMFNACNALSENQSLLSVTPLSNPWVIAACTLSMSLHFMVVYVPFFSNIFHLAPLSIAEWKIVFWTSFPVLFLDEILKFLSRRMQGRSRVEGIKKSAKKSSKLS